MELSQQLQDVSLDIANKNQSPTNAKSSHLDDQI